MKTQTPAEEKCQISQEIAYRKLISAVIHRTLLDAYGPIKISGGEDKANTGTIVRKLLKDDAVNFINDGRLDAWCDLPCYQLTGHFMRTLLDRHKNKAELCKHLKKVFE